MALNAVGWDMANVLLGTVTTDAAGAFSTPATIPAKPKSGPLTRRDSKLIEASTLIATEPPSGEDMAFTHAVLCQVGLPRAKVEGREFMRQSGAAWVNVQAGYLDEGRGPVLQPIPYGVMPRLAHRHGLSAAEIDDLLAKEIHVVMLVDLPQHALVHVIKTRRDRYPPRVTLLTKDECMDIPDVYGHCTAILPLVFR